MTQIFVGTCVPLKKDEKYYICHWDRDVARAVATGTTAPVTIVNDYTGTSESANVEVSIVKGLYDQYFTDYPTNRSTILEFVKNKNGGGTERSGRSSGMILMPLGYDDPFQAANVGEVDIGVCTLADGFNSDCTGFYGTGSIVKVPTRFLTDLTEANRSDARRIPSAYATRVLDASIDTLRTAGEPVWTTAEVTV